MSIVKSYKTHFIKVNQSIISLEWKQHFFINKLISLGSISPGWKGRIPWSRHRATSCWSWRLCGTLHLSSSRVVSGQIRAIWDPFQNTHFLISLEPFVFRFIGEAKTQASYLLPLSSLSLETLAGVRQCLNICNYIGVTLAGMRELFWYD